jgi:hypothetical protein
MKTKSNWPYLPIIYNFYFKKKTGKKRKKGKNEKMKKGKNENIKKEKKKIQSL